MFRHVRGIGERDLSQARCMTANAVAWGIASDHLPARGTPIYFSLHTDHRARSGYFADGGFNDATSGDYYVPGSVDSWLALPAGHRRIGATKPLAIVQSVPIAHSR